MFLIPDLFNPNQHTKGLTTMLASVSASLVEPTHRLLITSDPYRRVT